LSDNNATNKSSKKRSRPPDDQKEDDTSDVMFNEVFGREDVAKGKRIWEFVKRKTAQLRVFNISFPSKSNGYKNTLIRLNVSGKNLSKIPENYYCVKTIRQPSYDVKHSDQYIRKFVAPLVSSMMDEIDGKTDGNKDLK
jgi:hypothetical protein